MVVVTSWQFEQIVALATVQRVISGALHVIEVIVAKVAVDNIVTVAAI